MSASQICHYDPNPGITRPTEDGKRRLIRGEGFASRVSGTVRPQDPGGGATSVAALRLMKTDDISDTNNYSGGGGGWRPRAGEMRPAGVSVGGGDDGLPRVGNMLSSPDVAGRSLPVVPAGGPPQWVLRTLWAPMARLLQVAPLAHVRHCLHFSMTLWDR